MTPLSLLPAAEAEIAQAAAWYDGERPGLGKEFVRAVRKGLAKIAAAPERWPRFGPSRPERRVLLERFPYVVVYEVRRDQVVVKAIAHLKRKPGYWAKR